MSRSSLRLLLTSLLLVCAVVLAACGGGDDDDASETTPAAATTATGDEGGNAAETAGRKGGSITMLAGSDVDFLDPGRTYFSQGYMVVYATNRTLYGFTPDDAIKPVPDLAASDPEISADQKTVTVKLRTGVRYAPPVNREVTSKDVKYAFERFFSANVGGQYAGYFNMITGAPKEPTTGVRPISGIETPDDQTIVFKLDEPVGAAFAAALVMPVTAPVPEEYARPFDAKNPSTYNEQVVSTGPYMVKNDAKGRVTGYQPGKSISLVRNPNWDGEATGDYRPAYLDRIVIRTNASDATIASRQVLKDDNMLFDANPPASVLREVVTKIKDQYATFPAGNFRFFPLNVTVKPFDDLNVRRAVLAGFDREAVRLARGGRYVGDIATHFLPPGFPGFDEAGGAAGTGVDYLSDKNAKGDMALAAKYFKAAGYASGRYEGDEELLVVGSNVEPSKGQAEVAVAQLEKMGFKVRLRLVPQDAVYTDWCQVPAKNVAMCGGANWGRDFADAQSMLQPLFDGDAIAPDGGNSNFSELNDPKINEAMDKAALLTGDERIRAWADIDKMIVEQAAAIPFLWDTYTLIRSKNVNGVPNTYTTAWDLSFTSIT